MTASTMRRVRHWLTLALLVLLASKLTVAPGLSWWVVGAPGWLPVIAALVLPLFPAYRRRVDPGRRLSGPAYRPELTIFEQGYSQPEYEAALKALEVADSTRPEEIK